MPLEKDMDINKIINYLDNDLRKSIKNDVEPIIQEDNKEGGYFGVTRLVLCYIDYLGILYNGYHGKKYKKGRNKGRKILSDSVYAINFIKNILGDIHPNYKIHADLLYEMYRHGTVHLYQPKTFVNKKTGKILSWVAYKGKRDDVIVFEDPRYIGGNPTVLVEHMLLTQYIDIWVLPISINCLYDDLISSIDIFKNKLIKDSNLVGKWKSSANVLIEHEETDLNW